MIGSVLNLGNVVIGATRATAITAIRDCIMAVRDIQALNGMVPGWAGYLTATNATTTGGVTTCAFKSTEIGLTEWVGFKSITWNAEAAATAPLCLSSAALQTSLNSTTGTDGSWSNMADAAAKYIQTCTYDANGDLDTTTWS